MIQRTYIAYDIRPNTNAALNTNAAQHVPFIPHTLGPIHAMTAVEAMELARSKYHDKIRGQVGVHPVR